MRNVLLVIAATCGLSGCASREFHVRGEMNQKAGLFQDFQSNQTYQTVMASTQAFIHWHELKRLGLEDENYIMEFDAYTMHPKMPWEKYETIGICGDIHIEPSTPHDR